MGDARKVFPVGIFANIVGLRQKHTNRAQTRRANSMHIKSRQMQCRNSAESQHEGAVSSLEHRLFVLSALCSMMHDSRACQANTQLLRRCTRPLQDMQGEHTTAAQMCTTIMMCCKANTQHLRRCTQTLQDKPGEHATALQIYTTIIMCCKALTLPVAPVSVGFVHL